MTPTLKVILMPVAVTLLCCALAPETAGQCTNVSPSVKVVVEYQMVKVVKKKRVSVPIKPAPDILITLIGRTKGYKIQRRTNNDGSYLFTNVPGDTYDILTLDEQPITPPQHVTMVDGCSSEVTVKNAPVGIKERGAVPGARDSAARFVLAVYLRPRPGSAPAPQLPTVNTNEIRGRVVEYREPPDEGEQEKPVKPVAKARVELMVTKPGSARLVTVLTAVTGKDGKYTLEEQDAPGGFKLADYDEYVITVTRTGFDRGVLLLKSGRRPPDIELHEETFEGEEALVNTAEMTRRYTFLPRMLEALPLRGSRSADELALLAPGVAPAPQTFSRSGLGVSPGLGTAGQFSVNGLRSRENNFNTDGSDNNDENIGTRRQGYVWLAPQSVESLQEFHVITALADARFGRNLGGQINALTKSGQGEFHGTLYRFDTLGRLSARDYFDSAAPARTLTRTLDGAPVLLDGSPLVPAPAPAGKDRSRRSQLGAAAGWHLERPDAYLFVSLEQQRVEAVRKSHFAVPTVAQRGLFGSGGTGLLLNRFGGPAPLYPASIPGDALFGLYPLPNNPAGPYGENTYTAALPADGHGARFSVKVDRQLRAVSDGGDADKKDVTGNAAKPARPLWRRFFTTYGDHLTGRYNFTDERSVIPVTGGAIYSSLRPWVRTQNAAFFLNRSLNGRSSDTIRFSIGRTKLSFGEVRDPSLAPSGLLPDTPFLLNAPLLLNVTAPNPDGTLNPTSYISASSPAGAALLGSLGYTGVTRTEQITGPLGQVILPGFSPLGVDVSSFPQSRANNTFQIADTITTRLARHLLSYGFDARKTRINSTLEKNFRPQAVFDGVRASNVSPFLALLARPGGGALPIQTFSPATLAASGVPTGLFQTLAVNPDSAIGIHLSAVNLFFQDEWRRGPRVRLTLGARYELNTVPDTAGHRLERAFDAEELRAQATQAAAGCLPAGRCADLVGALTTAFPADFEVSFGADRNDFDGRVGFAWDVSGDGRTSLRGGFGTYSGQFPGIVLDQSRNAFSDFLPLNVANISPGLGGQTFLFNLANPAVRQLDPSLQVIAPGTLNTLLGGNPIELLVSRLFSAPSLSLAPPVTGLDLVLPQRKLKTPYSLQYAVTFERQFSANHMFAVSYVGTRGEKLLRMSTPDLGLNNAALNETSTAVVPLASGVSFPYFLGRLLHPQGTLISRSFAIARTFFESSATSSYDSLQVEYRKRFHRHLQYGSALTFSRATDDASDFFDTAGTYALPQDSLDRHERGPSGYDVRLRWVTHFVVLMRRDLPFTKAGGLGGWQLSGILTAQGGQPYTVNTVFDINRDGNLTDRLDTTSGLLFGPAGGDRSVQLRLAPGVTTASLLARDGEDGSVGRNTFRAPAVYNADVALVKFLNINERLKFLLRAEAFNLFNRAQFGVPERILESPAFGRATSTILPPRTLQLALKFQF